MTGLLDIIYAKLESAGVSTGNVGTWPAFIGQMPDLQDTMIGLQLTGGFAQDTLGDENLLQTFQVMIRAGKNQYIDCEAKWYAMYAALHSADLTASGVYLIQAMASGPMYFLDAKNRPMMSCNFKVMRDKS